MQMTARPATKAAARAARAQPAESRDRNYDKHLSYSATWGRSAVRAGSRGGRGVRATPGALETGVPGGHGRRRPQRGRSPPPPSQDSRGTRKRLRMAGRGLQREPGTENAPCARWPRLGAHNGSPSQQDFASRTEGTELHPPWPAAPRCRRGSGSLALKEPTQAGKPGLETRGGRRLRPRLGRFTLIAFSLS